MLFSRRFSYLCKNLCFSSFFFRLFIFFFHFFSFFSCFPLLVHAMDSVADEDIYWEAFFQSVPESVDLFAEGTDVDLSRRISPQESPKGSSNASPISISSWIDDLEQFLLDDDSREAAESHDFCGNFFSDIVPDSRPDGDVPVVGEIPSPEADSEEKEKSGVSDEDGAASKGEIQSPEMISAADEKESNENDSVSEERGRARDEDEDGEEDEQSRKKRKRQLRNRDSAMKSRERKKLYVRDLELKSRFLEGECKRLEYALRCSVAENQILYQRLQNEKGLDASVPKQESAVLLKESLPLGSLFWLISIMFVLLFPGLKLTVAVGRASSRRGDKGQEVVVEVRQERNEGSTRVRQGLVHMTRRCKATRTKMKSLCLLSALA